jgi:hypothetical protein
VELANLAGDTLDDVIAAAERGIHRIRRTHHLAFSFLHYCGLSLVSGFNTGRSAADRSARTLVGAGRFLPATNASRARTRGR